LIWCSVFKFNFLGVAQSKGTRVEESIARFPKVDRTGEETAVETASTRDFSRMVRGLKA
jgi:hypothetical protein